MSSFIRNIQRRIKRNQPDYEAAPQPFRSNEDGGYDVYHATRGWKHVSGKRLEAQRRMTSLLGGVM